MRRLLTILAMVWLVGCSGGVSAQAVTSRFLEPCKPQLDYSGLAWSPDGRTILATMTSSSGYGLTGISAANGRSAVLADPTSVNMSGSWSPDGRRIVFVSGRDNHNPFNCPTNCPMGLYLMAPDGTAQTRLTRQPDQLSQPQWSPDGRQVLFQLRRRGVPVGVGVVNADGSELRQLTTGGEDFPVWSPDGVHIAFWRFGSTQQQPGISSSAGPVSVALGIINRDGSGLRILETAQGGDPQTPAWSPDGTHLAFVGTDSGSPDIDLVGIDDHSVVHLTTDPAVDGYPSWSPDGSKIAFQSNRSGRLFQVFVMASDGSQQTRLTAGTSPSYGPVWSPDGTKIAFLSQRDGATEVYLMDANGAHQTRLTQNPANQSCLKWPF